MAVGITSQRDSVANASAADRKARFSSPSAGGSTATLPAGSLAISGLTSDVHSGPTRTRRIGLLDACDHVGLLLNGAAIAVNGRKFGAYEGYGDEG